MFLGPTKYSKYSSEKRAKFGRYADGTNIVSAVKKYQMRFQSCGSEQCLTLRRCASNKKNSPVEKLLILKTKHVRPKLLPKEIMKKTIQAMKSLRLNGASISYNVINAIAKGTVYTNDRTMLVEHGRHFTFTVNWAQNVFNEITRLEGEMAVANGYENFLLPRDC